MASKPKEQDTLRIWNAVCKTDPRHTKKVSQRGGFTAIDAQYQLMMATEQFGPVGEGWGYEVGEYNIIGNLIVVPVTLWHGNRENKFGPVLGCAEMLGQRVDRDAPKKAMTDAITKGLSQLGFNADVFLGLFDDNKYVERVSKEFANDVSTGEEPPKTPGRNFAPREKLEGPYSSGSDLQKAIRQFAAELDAIEDIGSLNSMMEAKETVALEEEAMRYLPGWWETGEGCAKDFEPMTSRIARKRRDLAQIDELITQSGVRNVAAG